jgi:hypothetical protein
MPLHRDVPPIPLRFVPLPHTYEAAVRDYLTATAGFVTPCVDTQIFHSGTAP